MQTQTKKPADPRSDTRVLGPLTLKLVAIEGVARKEYGVWVEGSKRGEWINIQRSRPAGLDALYSTTLADVRSYHEARAKQMRACLADYQAILLGSEDVLRRLA